MKKKRKQKPDNRLVPTLGGQTEVAPLIGPGWYGMVPAIFTEKRTLLVFVPQGVFETMRQTVGATEIRVATNTGDQALVTKLFHKV